MRTSTENKVFLRQLFGLTLLCVLPFTTQAADTTLVPFGSVWKYLDNGTSPGGTWVNMAFNDAAWPSDTAEFGFGEGDENTVISYGPDPQDKNVTTYFRVNFNVPDTSVHSSYMLRILKDDGAIVHLNGQEVLRLDMYEGGAGNNTLAYHEVYGEEEDFIFEAFLDHNMILPGNNILAVELHLGSFSSSDMSFDLELIAFDSIPEIYRRPYLQNVSSSAATLRWTTNAPCTGRVQWGNSKNSLLQVQDGPNPVMDHEITLTGLEADSTYFYSVGCATEVFAGADDEHYFRTAPIAGTSSPTRIWATGDVGFGTHEQQEVRDSYLNYIGNSKKADVWLMLGDNAYQQGRVPEYQIVVFDMYDTILRNTTLWPTPGNHEYYSGADAATDFGPYYDLFSLPKNGEAGGVASGTEAYYSFDHANIHFVSMDSHDSPRDSTGAMVQWLKSDLIAAQATSDWVIAFWHHPPYTKGSHDSDNINDSEGRMQDMREQVLPILEHYGVDMVLTGHSHNYERSYLIDRHYGYSNTFDPSTMQLNATSGDTATTFPYQILENDSSHHGTVYAICGVSGGAIPGASYPLDHPVMYYGNDAFSGSMIIDVDSLFLDAKFLNASGQVIDRFNIQKGVKGMVLDLKVMLGGPYEPLNLLMYDYLRVSGELPLTEPYDTIFTHVGKGASAQMSASVLWPAGQDAIVDWIFVEIRDKDDSTKVLTTRSLLVQRDGDVVDLDGITNPFIDVPGDAFFVSVRHRDHLGVMSTSAVQLVNDTLLFDFTDGSFAVWGTEAMDNISGTRVLWPGDLNSDGSIKYTGADNDRDKVLEAIGGNIPTNTVDGYRTEDANMDGTIKYTGSENDRDLILNSIGGIVPTNVREEQLPE